MLFLSSRYSSACSATTSFKSCASRLSCLTSPVVAARAVSPASRRLPASRNSFDQESETPVVLQVTRYSKGSVTSWRREQCSNSAGLWQWSSRRDVQAARAEALVGQVSGIVISLNGRVEIVCRSETRNP
jgi:hypothetical protein